MNMPVGHGLKERVTWISLVASRHRASCFANAHPLERQCHLHESRARQKTCCKCRPDDRVFEAGTIEGLAEAQRAGYNGSYMNKLCNMDGNLRTMGLEKTPSPLKL